MTRRGWCACAVLVGCGGAPDEDDHHLVVEGTRFAFSDVLPAGVEEPTREAPRVAVSEYIVEASFVAWGVAYTVAMECDNPTANPSCADPRAVLEVVEELRLVDSPAALREAR